MAPGKSGIGSGISAGSAWDWLPGNPGISPGLGPGLEWIPGIWGSPIPNSCGLRALGQIPSDPGEFLISPAGEVGQAPEEGESQRGHHQLRGGGEGIPGIPGISKFQREIPTFQAEIPTLRGEIPTFQGEIPTFQREIPTFQGGIPGLFLLSLSGLENPDGFFLGIISILENFGGFFQI